MNELPLRDLAPIVELQAVELKRLLTENDRLSRRVDALIGELGKLRALHSRELDLRQDSQAALLRIEEATQALGRRLTSAHSGPGSEGEAAPRDAGTAADRLAGKTDAGRLPGKDGPVYESREAIEETAAAVRQVLRARPGVREVA